MFKIYLKFFIVFFITNQTWSADKPSIEIVDNEKISEDYVLSETKDDDFDITEPQLISARTNQLVPPYAEVPIEYRRVCIYPNWSILRDSNMAKIFPEDIPADLCTHIHYAYANIDVRTLQLSPSQQQDTNNGDHGGPLYERIIKLKSLNPNLKVLISIGGWFAKSTPFNHILMSDTTRNTFIQNTLNFLRTWKFDGLDIQWEYPGDIEYGASPDSKQRFTSLIKYLNKAFKDEYKTNYKKYILTAFVPADETRIDDGYQVKLVCKYLDYVSVATYDYTGPYDTKTGYNSPLYSRTQVQNSVNSSIHNWLQRGCPAKKILVGLATYARAFKIIKRSNSPNLLYIGIESEPFTSPSIYTSEEGILSYYEVCEMMSNKETRVYWDDLAEVPFAIVSNTDNGSESLSNLWISYEDARSARKKVEYVKKLSLGGVSIWSLDMDDFKGWFCNLGPFPILESVKEEFEHKITLLTDENEDKEEDQNFLTTENKEDNLAPSKPNKHGTSTKENESKFPTKKQITTTKTDQSNNNNNNNNNNVNINNINTNNQEGLLDSSDVFSKKLKKFKAVREIKLISCLNNLKCSLNNSFNFKFNKFYIFLILFFEIFSF